MSAQYLLSKFVGLALKIRLYWITLSYLKPSQIAYLPYRRFFPKKLPRIEAAPKENARFSLHKTPTNKRPLYHSDGFKFINRHVTWSINDEQWDRPEQSMLWRYNLQYFDWLKDERASIDWMFASIHKWITTYPEPVSPAWDPYPLSLRIVNWIKYFQANEKYVSESARKSLYRQADWLKRNLEKDILANHYFKNAVALFWAGAYFWQDSENNEFLVKATTILMSQLDEQFFNDGGHFERSPMYHAIMLEDVLDVINVIESNPYIQCSTLTTLKSKALRVATKGLLFLYDMVMTDGKIALLNDSAWNNAISLNELEMYFRKVVGADIAESVMPEPDANQRAVLYPDSKIFVHRHLADSLIMDCGAITPSYQPGHAHAGIGSFEWVVEGQRVVVDTGVYDYSTIERRQYARSTAAHNTVRINQQNQSELWSNFRVARRANVGAVSLKAGDNCSLQLYYESALYPRACKVGRKLSYDGSATWTLMDDVTAKEKFAYESFLHIHPYHKVVINADYAEIIRRSDNLLVAKIIKQGNVDWTLESAEWYPEFNVAIEITVIRFYAKVDSTFSTQITLKKAC